MTLNLTPDDPDAGMVFDRYILFSDGVEEEEYDEEEDGLEDEEGE